MLLRQPRKLTPRKMTLRLPDEVWQRLDRIQLRARNAGMALVVEEALADYLSRQISRAERQLRSERSDS